MIGMRIAAMVLAAGAISACGFTPLYGEVGVARSLPRVAIETPPHSRTGYLMRQQLDDEFGRDRGAPPIYNLSLSIDERRYPRGVRVNNVANRYEISLNVGYILTELSTGKVIYQGAAAAQVSYDSADAPYAGVAASQDGEERAANQAAVRIRLDLARWLAAHPQPAAKS